MEDFLSELVATADGADITVSGERQPLPAEASQAVRRVAQEALTNVRKHAPGAKVHLRLEYGEHEVTLGVRDSGGPPGELSGAGPGTVCWACGSVLSCWAARWRPGRTRRVRGDAEGARMTEEGPGSRLGSWWLTTRPWCAKAL